MIIFLSSKSENIRIQKLGYKYILSVSIYIPNREGSTSLYDEFKLHQRFWSYNPLFKSDFAKVIEFVPIHYMYIGDCIFHKLVLFIGMFLTFAISHITVTVLLTLTLFHIIIQINASSINFMLSIILLYMNLMLYIP